MKQTTIDSNAIFDFDDSYISTLLKFKNILLYMGLYRNICIIFDWIIELEIGVYFCGVFNGMGCWKIGFDNYRIMIGV